MAPATRYTTPLTAIHKATDPARLSVTAALTYPGADRAGDIVNPTGGDYSLHESDPRVGYEHRCWNKSMSGWVYPEDRESSGRPVFIGTARDPGTGSYSVVLKSVSVNGKQTTLPFGTTYFSQHDELQSQMFRLIEDDTLPAVSLEMTLQKGRYRELGPSPIELRPAFQLDGWNCLRWVHCAEPVNPGALTLRKGLSPAWERALRIAETGRIGSELAHPLIHKAFRDRFTSVKPSTVAGGYSVRKAMDPKDQDQLDPAYTDTPTEPDGDEAPVTDSTAVAPSGNGITAVYDVAQQIEDLSNQLMQVTESTDSAELAKDVQKLSALITAAAEKVKAIGDRHQAKLDAVKGGSEPDEPSPDDAPDMTKDDDGVLKAMKAIHYKAIRAARWKRFNKAEVDAAPVVSAVQPAAASQSDELTAERVAAIRESNPKLYRQIARDLEKLSALV